MKKAPTPCATVLCLKVHRRVGVHQAKFGKHVATQIAESETMAIRNPPFQVVDDTWEEKIPRGTEEVWFSCS
jgi:hypothetical protein